MKKPLTLSIVIPAYNESHQIRDCLDAISMQEVAPNEVIVVDNNSTDDTVKIAREYSFVKIVHEKKQGVLAARNKGFDSVTSDIIARIDADSILPPNWVETVKNFYSKKSNLNYAWTSGGYFYNLKLQKIHSWLFMQIFFKLNRFLLGSYALWGSSMAFPALKWPEIKNKICSRDDIHEDLDIAVHLQKIGMKVKYETNIKVAVKLRRVFSNKDKLWKYLLLWPQTLKAHNRKTWVIAWFGAAALYTVSPVARFNDKVVNFEKEKLKVFLDFINDI